MKKLLFNILLLSCIALNAHNHDEGTRYIKNHGQWNSKVLYKADLGNGALFLEKDRFTFNLYNADEYHKNHTNPTATPIYLKTHAYQVEFLNALSPSFSAKGDFPEYYNFITNRDQKKHQSKLKAKQTVTYNNLYKGVDLSVYSAGNFIKYDFILAPNADASNIELRYNGVDKLKIDYAGNLVTTTSLGKVIEQKPYAYQIINGAKQEVKCKYVLENQTVSFSLGKYNKDYELVIDPVLIFGSYSGSTGNNFGMTATYGNDGSLFAGGIAFGAGYPTTLGAFDETFNGTPSSGIVDVVISRYDSTGSNLIYSTYFGGISTETVHSLIATPSNDLFFYGVTSSLDLPVTPTAHDTSFNGGQAVYYTSNGTNFTNGTDIYVAKLSADGSTLLGSTYIGGSQNDGINATVSAVFDSLMNNYSDQFRGEVMLDENGDCYLSSSTKSVDFPVINGFDNSLGGNQDAVVLKLNDDLSQVYWSTYLGGDEMDAGYSLKLDTAGNVYTCGGTFSSNFPTSAGALNESYSGGKADGFLTKISADGTQIEASTLLGTSEYDQCYFIEIDRFGSIYTVGQTRGNFPILNSNYSDANSSNFIVKTNNDFTSMYYSTLFGNGDINAKFCPSAFLVDNCENVYVSGWGGDIVTGTSLTGMPTTSNAVFPNTPNGFDFYLIVLERDVESLLYGTYFGGPTSREHVDGGTSRFDKNGIVYQSVCAGCQNNDDFPTTPGAWSNENESTGCNNGTFKFDFEIVPKAKFTPDYYEGCAPLTVTFNNASNGGDEFLWDFGNGDTTSTEFNPIRTFTDAGTYTVSLIIKDSICNTLDTAIQTITVNPEVALNITQNQITTCDSAFLSATASNADTIIWSTNNQFSDTLNTNFEDSIYVSGTGSQDYYAMTTNGVCSDTVMITVNYQFPPIADMSLNNQQGCAPFTVDFSINSTNYDSFLWDFGNNDTTSQSTNPIKTYNTAGTYPVTLIVYDAVCDIYDTTNTIITVAEPVSVSIPNNPITTCDSVWLYANHSGADTFIWSSNSNFSDTLNTDLTTDSLELLVNNSATYYLLATNGVCSDTASVQVNFIGIDVTLPNGAICSGQNDTIEVINNTNEPLTYSWEPQSEIISGENTATPIVNPPFTTVYYVELENSFGCSTTDSATVFVSGFNPDDIIITADKDTLINGEGTYLHAHPDTNFSHIWTPSSSLNNNTIAHPFATPTSETTYTITLTENESGCSYSETYTLYAFELNCQEPDVFVPNAFTPNGDKENDILYVRGRFVEEMLLRIYDRWGELVFETDNQSAGWDGNYKGKPVDPAVFVYYLTVKCVDGQEYFKKGNVTVIR